MNFKDTCTLNNGIEIPILGYGTFQTPDDESGVTAIIEAIKAGYKHIDTAQGYHNEGSVGKAVKLAGVPREELFITTKVTNSIRGLQETKDSIDESLKILDMGYIDLVLIHWPNPLSFRDNWEVLNAETWKALEEYYEAGKIKAIGISNFRPHHIEALLKTAKVIPAVNQIRLCPGDIHEATKEICEKHNIVLEAYSPLGQGAVFAIEELKEIADKHHKNIAQVSLRWSLQKGFIPLPKSVTKERLIDNTKLFDFELSETEMETITNLTGRCGLAKDPDTVPF